MPRGVFERKPRKPKSEVETKIKKVKNVKKETKVKTEKIKKIPAVETTPKVVVESPMEINRRLFRPAEYPAGIELVDISVIPKELRAEVSVFHADGTVQFARMMFKNYGIKKFTVPVYKNSKWFFFYEEPLLATRNK